MSSTACASHFRPVGGPLLAGRFLSVAALLAALASPITSAQTMPLVVVEDRGGTSALPYYEALNLKLRSPGATRLPITISPVLVKPATEADMLPVRSPKLTPGTVVRRVIEAPGLQPFFLVGDDDASHAWLHHHAASLQERGAVGLVVNVETIAGLTGLRERAPDLQLAPVAADDLAGRLGIQHYPVLITRTGIEQ